MEEVDGREEGKEVEVVARWRNKREVEEGRGWRAQRSPTHLSPPSPFRYLGFRSKFA